MARDTPAVASVIITRDGLGLTPDRRAPVWQVFGIPGTAGLVRESRPTQALGVSHAAGRGRHRDPRPEALATGYEYPDTREMVENPYSWAAPRSVQDVGAFVGVVRRRSGLTQAQLAERVGVGRRFVNELETGHSTLFLDRLAAVLNELGIRVVLDTGEASSDVRPGPSDWMTSGDIEDGVRDLGW